MNDTTRIYHFVEKQDWPQGPWQGEPDKVQWVDETTQLDCLIVRNPAGALCGYVGVAESHPWFGVGYNSCVLRSCDDGWCEHAPDQLIDVHGGLTYSDFCQEGRGEDGICHIAFEGRPEKIWWFGFDTAHAGDLVPSWFLHFPEYRHGVYCDLAYLRRECQRLAQQLAAQQPPLALPAGA